MQLIRKTESGYRLDEYLQYLKANADNLPAGAREFALADWHYDFAHRQCPHDSWLEEFKIKEVSSGARSQVRWLEIATKFLGAYHDGYFNLNYRGVVAYSLKFGSSVSGHGDWIIDEITMGESSTVQHEIAFSEATVFISCTDFDYRWTPIGEKHHH